MYATKRFTVCAARLVVGVALVLALTPAAAFAHGTVSDDGSAEASSTTSADYCAGDGESGFRIRNVLIIHTSDTSDQGTMESRAANAMKDTTDRFVDSRNNIQNSGMVPQWFCEGDSSSKAAMTQTYVTGESNRGTALNNWRQANYDLATDFSQRIVFWFSDAYDGQGCPACANVGTIDDQKRLSSHTYTYDAFLARSIGSSLDLPGVLQHELFHTLSAVNEAAPGHNDEEYRGCDSSSSSGNHTCDWKDVMSYFFGTGLTWDSTDYTKCSKPNWYIDCGRNTYFAREPSGWLDDQPKYNLANSPFFRNSLYLEHCGYGGCES